MTHDELYLSAARVSDRLRATQQRIVFAESCTGGLLSATLTLFPGISEFHCGSAVVYRIETKEQWLQVDRRTLEDPGPVSVLVAKQMAVGVLNKTSEATISAAITGHLGPHAPEDQDGLVYIGVATRTEEELHCEVYERWLTDDILPTAQEKDTQRTRRQRAAAIQVFECVAESLSSET